MSSTRSRNSQAGQTLIEVLVTALLVALVSAATATALIATAHASGDQRLHATADALAAQDQERMRSLSDAQLAALGGSGQRRTSIAEGVTFTITSTTTAVAAGGGGSCVAQGAANFQITSTVTWTVAGGGGQESVSANSLVARPTTGDLLATATDQTGAALPGVSVQAVENDGEGTDQQTGSTDQNGCLLLAGLDPGGYQVTFSKLGYVDQTGNPTPSTSVPVTATGTPTPNAVVMGQAGTIEPKLVTSPRDAQGTTLLGDADGVMDAPVSTSAARLTTTSPRSTFSSTSTPSAPSISGLFPFDTAPGGPPSYASNYVVWAGGCSQQEPPAANLSTASVTPGGDVTTLVTEPALDLTAVTDGATKVTPTKLVLTFASLTGTTCTDTWSPPVAAAASPGIPQAGNWLQHPGQPYADGTSGTLTICAQYPGGPLGIPRSGTATTTNLNFAIGAVTPVAISINRLGGC